MPVALCPLRRLTSPAIEHPMASLPELHQKDNQGDANNEEDDMVFAGNGFAGERGVVAG